MNWYLILAKGENSYDTFMGPDYAFPLIINDIKKECHFNVLDYRRNISGDDIDKLKELFEKRAIGLLLGEKVQILEKELEPSLF